MKPYILFCTYSYKDCIYISTATETSENLYSILLQNVSMHLILEERVKWALINYFILKVAQPRLNR